MKKIKGKWSFLLIVFYMVVIVINPAMINVKAEESPPVLQGSGNEADFISGKAAVCVDPNLTLSGEGTIDGAQIYIGDGFVKSEDSLIFTNQSNITGSYNSDTGVMTLSGVDTIANYQTALRTIKFNDSSASPNTTQRKIVFCIGGKVLYCPPTKHYYQYVDANAINWNAAKTAAENSYYYGLQGYLVTITSQAENDFVQNKIAGNTWLGASDDSPNQLGYWTWRTGPEVGQCFWNRPVNVYGTQSKTSSDGNYTYNSMYNNWHIDEPNNYENTNERYAHMYSDSGTWNDFNVNNTSITGYVIEYSESNPSNPDLHLSAEVAVNVHAANSIVPSLTASPNAAGNYVKLDWQPNDSSQSYHYMVKKMDLSNGTSTFESIPLKNTAKVLNVYPGAGDGSTISFSTWDGQNISNLSKSASVKMWMEAPTTDFVYGSLTKGYGQGKIAVDTVYIGDFNSNPDNYLKNPDGSYKYDVVFIGAWDANNNKDISTSAEGALQTFISSGGGYLSGHDTANIGNTNLVALAQANLNMDCNSSYGLYGDNSGNSNLSIIKKGMLTNYPWILSSDKLTVPASHSTNQFAKGNVWMKYDTDARNTPQISNSSGTNNFYLTTWNNCAMIQTGHSNGAASADEQKVLANTLLYLSQVSTDTTFDDHTSQDVTAPNSVSNVSMNVDSNRNGHVSFDNAVDNGNSYEYQLMAFGNTDKKTYTSGKIQSTITSGIKGYAVVVDQNPNTDPGTTVNATTNSFTASTPKNGTWYVHVRTIDNAGNASTVVNKSFNVSINHAPVLSSSSTGIDPIMEDTSNNQGTLVSSLLSGKASDEDINSLGLAVTSADDSHGNWEYTIDGSQWWTMPRDLPSLSENDALLLPATAKIRFNPAANYNGASSISYRAWDGTSGTSEGRYDVSTNGGITAFSSVENTANITVTAVNDAPTILKKSSTKALQFDGGNGHYMAVPDMNLNNSFTVEAWVYAASANNYSRVFDFGGGSDNNNLWLGFSGGTGQMEFEAWNGTLRENSFHVTTSEVLPLNSWIHVTAVYDDSNKMAYIYWNGEVKACGKMDLTHQGTIVRNCSYFGKSNWAEDSPFNGKMHDMSIWNAAKTQAQIQSDMNNTFSGSETNLVAYYPLTEGSGTTVSDITGKFNGTLTGVNWVDNSAFLYNVSGVLNSSIDVSKMYLNDVDAGSGNMTLTLSANNGTLSFDTTAGLTFTAGGNGQASFTVDGSITDINNALATLKYHSSTGYIGQDTISVNVSDNGNTGAGGALTDSKTINVNVLPSNECTLYSIKVPSGAVITNKNISASVSYLASSVAPSITLSNNASWKLYKDIDCTQELEDKVFDLNVGNNQAYIKVIAQDGITYNLYTLNITRAIMPPVAGSGYGLQFNGTDNYVDIPANSAYNTNTFTAEAWVKNPDTASYESIIDKGRNLNHNWYILSKQGSQGIVAGIQGGGELTYTWTDANWHHIAITYDGSYFTLYVDGLCRGSKVVSGYVPVNSDIMIGKRVSDGDSSHECYLKGSVDEVRLWNRSLSQIEIYNDRFKHFSGSETGLVGYWAFDEGTGKITADGTSNLNNAVLKSSAGVLPLWFRSNEWATRTVVENKSLVISAGYDVNNIAVTVSQVLPCQHGSISISGYSIEYTPDKDYVGTDSFTYNISDNNTTQSYTVGIYVEDSKTVIPNNPAITNIINYTDSKWYNSTQTITSSFAPREGYNEKLQYKLDDGTWIDGDSVSVSNEGKHIAAYRTIDFLGNTSDEQTLNVNIDLTKPSIESVTYSTTGWTKDSVTLTVNVNDTLSGLAANAYSFDGGTTWQSSNTNTYTHNVNGIQIKVIDNAGNITSYTPIDITNIDNTPPNTPTIAKAEDYTDNKWYNSGQTITASFIKTDGCDERLQYKINDGSWTDGDSVSISDDGRHSVSFRTTDLLGEISSEQTVNVNIDKTAPENLKITIKDNDFTTFMNTITFGLFFNASTDVSIAADGNISGINHYEYQMVDTSKGQAFDENGTWKTGASFSISPQFKGVIYARAIDNAGNVSNIVSSNGTVVDNTIPSVPAIQATIDDQNYTGQWTTKNILIKASDSKVYSGIDHYEYKIGSYGEWNKMTQSSGAVDSTSGNTINDEVTIDKDIIATCYVRAVSNTSIDGTEASILLKRDSSVPKTTVSFSGTVNSWTKNPVTFTLDNTNDNNIAPVYYYVKIGSADWSKITGNSYTFSDEINQTVQFKSVTASGVEDAYQTSYNVKIDKTNPVITGANDSSSYYIGRVMSISDPWGEISSSVYTKDNGTQNQINNGDLVSNPGAYSINVTDKAGNTCTLTFTVKVLPNISDILYNADSKKLIQDIRAEFNAHNDLPEPYKTDMNNAIKALEDRYAELDKEVKDEITATNAIPTADDGLIAQKNVIQGVLIDISKLTKEQQASLKPQVDALNALLLRIEALQGQVDQEVAATSAIPTADDGLIAQKDTIQGVLADISKLTKEQQTILKPQVDALNALLSKIGTLQDQIDQEKAAANVIPTTDDGLIAQKDAIQGVLSDISKLTKEQQSILKPQVDALNALLAKIGTLQDQIDKEKAAANSIPTADDGLIAQKDIIQGVLADISKLTEEQQTILKPQIDALNALLAKIGTLQGQILKEVVAANAIPTADDGLIAQKDTIQGVLADISKLTKEQQTILKPQIDALNALLAKIGALQGQIDQEVAAASAIPTVDDGLIAQKDAIQGVLADISKLTKEQQTILKPQVDALNALLSKIGTLQDQIDQEKAAANAIPTTDDGLIAQKDAIQGVLAEISKLTKEQQTILKPQLDALNALLSKIEVLQGQIEKEVAAANAIPTADDGLIAQKDTIQGVLADISKLTKEQQAILKPQVDALNALLAKIETLQGQILKEVVAASAIPTADDGLIGQKDTIQGVLGDISKLTKEQQTILKPQVDALNALLSKIGTLQDQIDQEKAAANAIPTTDDGLIAQKDAIQGVLADISKLTSEQQAALKPQIDALKNLLVRIDALQGQIGKVAAAVTAIPKVDDGLIAQKDAIQGVLADIGKLTKEQQTILKPQVDALNALLSRIEVLQGQVDKEVVAANEIPTADDGLIAQKDTIQGMLADISKLTKEQQTILKPQVDALKALLSKIGTLQDQINQDKAAVNAIPTADDGLMAQKDTIQDVLDNISKLTKEQQAILKPQIDALNALLSKIGTLQDQIDQEKAAANAIPTADDGLIAQKDTIQGVLSDISKLTKEQQASLKPQVDALNALLSKIGTLQDQIDQEKAAANAIPTADDGLIAQKDTIQGVLTDISKLTKEQQEALKPQIDALNALISKIGTLQDQIDQEKAAVNAINTADDGLISQKGAIEKILSDISKLTPEQQEALKSQIDELNALLAKISALQDEIGKEEAAANAIPTADDGLIAQKDTIQGVLADISKLTKEQQEALKPQIDALNALLSKIGTLQDQIDQEKAAVNAINTADDGLIAQKDAIEKILSDISKLTPEQQEVLKSQIDELNALLAKITALQAEIGKEAAAAKAIPSAEDGLIAQKGEIEGVLSDISKLTKEQQAALKSQVDTLNSLLDKIKVLQNQVDAEKQAITALPTALAVTRNDATSINNAKNGYDKLNTEQKTLVGKDLTDKLNNDLEQLAKLMLHDTPYDVTITALDGTSFSPDTYLLVTPITQAKNAGELQKAQSALDNAGKANSALADKDIVALYDVSMMKGNVEIEPDGKVKVKIKIPDSLKDIQELDIVHFADDGTVTSMHATREGNYLVFITDHFSKYGIVAKNTCQLGICRAIGLYEKDGRVCYCWAFILGAALIVAGASSFIVYKKRKRKIIKEQQ